MFFLSEYAIIEISEDRDYLSLVKDKRTYDTHRVVCLWLRKRRAALRFSILRYFPFDHSHHSQRQVFGVLPLGQPIRRFYRLIGKMDNQVALGAHIDLFVSLEIPKNCCTQNEINTERSLRAATATI